MQVGKILVTNLGLVLIATFILILFFKRTYLPAFFVVLTIFQAGSVVNIELINAGTKVWDLDYQVISYGLNPYIFFAPIIFLYFILKIKLVPALLKNEYPLRYLLLFCIIGIIGAFALPLLFEGIPVYSPLERHAAEYPPSPLKFGVSNFVQAASILINTVFVFYIFQQAIIEKQTIKIIQRGFWFGFFLVCAIQIYERAAWLLEWQSFNWFFLTNTGYALSGEAKTQSGLLRIGSPFSEPSYSAAYMASIFCGLIGLISLKTIKEKKWMYYLLAVISFILTINIISTTGLILVAIGILIFSIHIALKSSLKFKIAIFILGSILITIIALFFNHSESFKLNANEFIFEKFIYAADRFNADFKSLSIFLHTYGLGVGIGSNRPSSLIASLMSNMGLMGLVLHSLIIIHLLKTSLYSKDENLEKLFYLLIYLFFVLAMYLSIPDINLPLHWVIMTLALLSLSETQKNNENI